jgi:hypothetical protein
MCCDWLWVRLDSEKIEENVIEGCRGSECVMKIKP